MKISLTRRLAFALVALLLFVFAGEIVCRTLLYSSPYEPCPERSAADVTLLGDLRLNVDEISLMDRNFPFREQTNSQGLRRATDVELPKPTGVYRVLCVGDSFTYGPYVGNDDTFPGQLETRLNKQLEGRLIVEALNAGVSGYTICDEFSLIAQRGSASKPDLVVLQVLANDLYGMYDFMRQGFCRGGQYCAKPLPDGRSLGPRCVHRALLARSALYRGVRELLDLVRVRVRELRVRQARQAQQQRGDDHMTRYFNFELAQREQHEQRYAEIFAATVALCREQQIALLVLLPGKTNMPGVREYFARLCAEQGVELVDTFDEFSRFEMDQTYLFPKNGHLSRMGNILVAQQLAAAVSPRINAAVAEN
ncbi:MAG: SGNH/GDSL hydrolase family protein [Candidatus Alcyoniella australis]|nr:SGNH/GDSL hydrolase family protein [Candidatus Alcyoniella australis]